MALKAMVDDLEKVDEKYRDLYTKKGDKWEFTGVEGLKTQGDMDRVQGALNNERKLHEETKTKLSAWGERKPEEIIPILDALPELQAAAEAGKKKLDQTQIDAIVNGRVAPLQRDLDKFKKDVTDRDAMIAAFQAKDTRRTVMDTVRGLAAESKANPEAYSSDYGGLVLLAEKLFTVDAAGKVVVREGAQDFQHGTLAKDCWQEIQSRHPYLWPASQGGGASGSQGGGGGSGIQGNPFKRNGNISERTRFAAEHPDKVAAYLQQAGLDNTWDPYVEKK